MNNNHIIEILDGASVASLSQSELDAAEAHCRECAPCRGAFESAQLCAAILKERAQVSIDPSPFFQTRVMAAWREQQAAESVPAFRRLWQSASVLVSTMALATLVLGVVSFVSPDQQPVVALEQTSSAYSAESVVFGSADEQLTYEQVLNTIYDDEDEAR
jgi:anti-sigma-K factor RskA